MAIILNGTTGVISTSITSNNIISTNIDVTNNISSNNIVVNNIDIDIPLDISEGGTGLSSVGNSGNVLVSNGINYVSQKIDVSEIGELKYFANTPSDNSWLLCNGSILLQNSYPDLYIKVGNIPTASTWTVRTSGTSTVIQALTYGTPGGNGLFVRGGYGGELGTSLLYNYNDNTEFQLPINLSNIFDGFQTLLYIKS